MNRAITGIRPTGDLSVANYVGAMKPFTEMQETYDGPISIFVADIHGLTDQEPELINRTRLDTVKSFLAAGIDPIRSMVYMQSQIETQTVMLAHYLDRNTTVSELLRVPTLKDKVKKDESLESVNVALARYPILMAADIFIQDATDVPVGEDQRPHIEFARDLARKFNNAYGREDEPVLITPEMMVTEAPRIVALNGAGKMSKSQPKGAIFLKDTPEDAADKIKRAKTAHPGETSEVLESHLLLCDNLMDREDARRERMHEIMDRHLAGGQVMGEFKKVMTDVVVTFLDNFQTNYAQITDTDVTNVLKTGGEQATEQADKVLGRVKKAMGI